MINPHDIQLQPNATNAGEGIFKTDYLLHASPHSSFAYLAKRSWLEDVLFNVLLVLRVDMFELVLGRWWLHFKLQGGK